MNSGVQIAPFARMGASLTVGQAHPALAALGSGRPWLARSFSHSSSSHRLRSGNMVSSASSLSASANEERGHAAHRERQSVPAMQVSCGPGCAEPNLRC